MKPGMVVGPTYSIPVQPDFLSLLLLGKKKRKKTRNSP